MKMMKQWTDNELIKIVPFSRSYLSLVRNLGITRTDSRIKELKNDISRLDLDISHFVYLDERKGRWRFTEEEIRDAVVRSITYSNALRLLRVKSNKNGSFGQSLQDFKNRCVDLNIDTSHFKSKGWNKDRRYSLDPDKILVFNPTLKFRVNHSTLKRALLAKKVVYVCKECGLDEWRGKLINLKIDHVDGNWKNNIFVNLRFLCPNCHDQTDTFGNKKRIL